LGASPVAERDGEGMRLTILYLVAIAEAEVVTNF
jgi:hypothetical protein